MMRGTANVARCVVLGCAALVFTASALPTSSASADVPKSSTQRVLDRVLAKHPGGLQVSDNAIMWGDADAVLVVPDPGERYAPAGLGKHVRFGLLRTPAKKALVDARAVPADRHGCPGGLTSREYYCFFQYRDYGGRRVQFTNRTSYGTADEYGFDNGTSSVVQNDTNCYVTGYDGRGTNTPELFRYPDETSVSYVGSANDNKMSSWKCD